MTRDAEHTPNGYGDAASVVVNQAPAPSSLAGGEDAFAHDLARTLDRYGLKDAGWSDADIADALEMVGEPSGVSQATVKAIMPMIEARLAALSPEAPAREGEVISAARAVIDEASNIAMTMRRRKIFLRLKDALATKTPMQEGKTERRLRWAVVQMREVLSRLQYSDNAADFEESRVSGVTIADAALTPRHEAPASDEVSEALVEAYRYISQPQSMGQGQATYSTAEYNRLTAKIRTAIGWEGTK